MKYRKGKKIVAGFALVLAGFGVFDSTAGALCKPTPDTHPVKASPYNVICQLRCK